MNRINVNSKPLRSIFEISCRNSLMYQTCSVNFFSLCTGIFSCAIALLMKLVSECMTVGIEIRCDD